MSRAGRFAELDAMIARRNRRIKAPKAGPGKPLVPLSELARIIAKPPVPPVVREWTGNALVRAIYAATGVRYEITYGATLLRRAKAFAAQKAAGA